MNCMIRIYRAFTVLTISISCLLTRSLVYLMDRDHRITRTLGTLDGGSSDAEFQSAGGVAFDPESGLLYAIDIYNHRVQAFSSDDGRFVGKFGSYGKAPGGLSNPEAIAIDGKRSHIVVADTANHRVQVRSLTDEFRLVFEVGQQGKGPLEFCNPTGVAIDSERDRILVVDCFNNRIQVLSAIDGTFLSEFGSDGDQAGLFDEPTGVAFDRHRDRIVVADHQNNRVQIFAAGDFEFLLEFTLQDGEPFAPHGVCVDHDSRILVADHYNERLEAFTPHGQHIGSFYDSRSTGSVAFDECRGLIAFNSLHQVHVIGANQWLPHTFVWRTDRHCYAPASIKQAVETVTMIRSHGESPLLRLPNELLFEIYSYL